MNNKENLKIAFFVALTDVFRNVEDRQLSAILPVNPETEYGNDLVLAMFYALQALHIECTGTKVDPLEFISILTRLLFQEQSEAFKGGDIDEDTSTDE